jgi:Spy/CpxP family protein refolding chaperone
MTKAKVLLVLALAIVFAAGVAVGLVWAHRGPPRHGPSWLTTELGLTDAQRDAMHEIWSEVARGGGPGQWEQRRTLAQERDAAIAALVTDAQRAQYDAILKDYSDKIEAHAKERELAFQQAIERTKAILTPEQAAKYDQLMKERRERGPGDRPGGPWKGPPRDRRSPRDGPPPDGPPPGEPQSDTQVQPTPRGGG